MLISAIKKIVYLSFLVVIFACGINFWLNNKKYIFTEDAIVKIAKRHIEPKADMGKVIESIYKDFKTQYPHHILPKEDLKFVFFSAGGWTGAIYLLHASLTEFVLVYGTALDTAGHSGRYWMNRTDVVLTGQFIEWNEGEINARILKAGDVAKHAWGEAYALNYKANMWKLSYGRGFVLSALPFTVADVVFGNQDYISLYHILRIHVKSILQELIYSVGHFNELF